MADIPTHVGFSDEAYWNKGPYRSLACVTTPLNKLDKLEFDVRTLLQESNVTELQWKELNGAKERLAAEKIIKLCIDCVCRKDLRIDVLIWDIQDKRHAVMGRDDVGNLSRMYYHLFRDILRKRWPDEAVWRLHPDEHGEIDWVTTGDCLAWKAKSVIKESIFYRNELRQNYKIHEINSVKSHEYPLLQIADLFAGLSVFSRLKYAEYKSWEGNVGGQGSLFPRDDIQKRTSRSSIERFQLLSKFKESCEQYGLGVSLEFKKGLWTPNPTNPINFWPYEPQHRRDKAPVKSRLWN